MARKLTDLLVKQEMKFCVLIVVLMIFSSATATMISVDSILGGGAN